MISSVIHIGITVADIERSIAFYRDILGFEYQSELVMEGKETDLLFNKTGCKARVAYLNPQRFNGSQIELIQFISHDVEKQQTDLFRTSVSEICFSTDDIEKEYKRLSNKGVEFLSKPQEFDFSDYGFGKSKAVYFRDLDGNILELIEEID